jgi:hypothetical protein
VTTPASSPEITCNLGAAVTWAAGDIIRVTVPVVAGQNAGQTYTNKATVIDNKNQTASDDAMVELCKDCGIDGVSNKQQVMTALQSVMAMT